MNRILWWLLVPIVLLLCMQYIVSFTSVLPTLKRLEDLIPTVPAENDNHQTKRSSTRPLQPQQKEASVAVADDPAKRAPQPTTPETLETLSKHETTPPIQENKSPPEKYLTYIRARGRLNNQLFTFVGTLQLATILNRTLIVPPETERELWTGMFDGKLTDVWDLTSLNEHYKIDWVTARSQPVENVTNQCTFNYHKLRNQLDGGSLPRPLDDLCPILRVRHSLLPFCGQQHRFCGPPEQERIAYDIVSRFKISPSLRQFMPTQRFPIGVHSRTIGGKAPFPTPHCLSQTHKVTDKYIPPELQTIHNTQQKVSDYCALWHNLPSQLSPEYKPFLANKTQFFLASDVSFDWSTSHYDKEFLLLDFEPVQKWLASKFEQALAVNASQDLSPHVQDLFTKAKFIYGVHARDLAASIVDMFTLAEQTDYFVSNPVSTVATTVCLLRGEARKYNSNVCWMLLHPESQYAVFPEYLLPATHGTLEQPARGESFLTYSRSGGGLAHEILDFATALQHAAILKRTLIVPPETTQTEWSGFVDGHVLDLWDLSSLNDSYRIDWTTALAAPVDVPEECTVTNLSTLLQEDGTAWENCRVLNFSFRRPTLFGCQQKHPFCGSPAQQRIAYEIVGHLKISKDLGQLMSTQMLPLAVHSSTLEGEPPFPSKECTSQSRNSVTAHISPAEQATLFNDQVMHDYCALWYNLSAHLLPEQLPLVNNTQFFLVSDDSHNWNNSFHSDRFRTIDSRRLSEWMMSKIDHAMAAKETSKTSPYLQSLFALTKDDVHLHATKLAADILNMFTLTKETAYFVSNPVSAMTMNVCLLRGEAVKYNSNVCWMLLHADTEHAELPKHVCTKQNMCKQWW